jgi:hypothetical protein
MTSMIPSWPYEEKKKKKKREMGFSSINDHLSRKAKTRGGRAVRTEAVEEDEEILIGSVIAWGITERRRDGC